MKNCTIRIPLIIVILLYNVVLFAQTTEESYYPTNEIRNRTDSIFSKTPCYWEFRSIPNNYVVQDYEVDGKNHRAKYRNNELEIGVGEHRFYISKEYFENDIDYDYSKDFILRFIDFEGFSAKTNELKFFLSINKPETDWSYHIYFFIKLDGTSRVVFPTFEDDY